MLNGAEFEAWPGEGVPSVGERVHVFDRDLEFTQHDVVRVKGQRVWIGPAVPFARKEQSS
jgi:hypothetical protein